MENILDNIGAEIIASLVTAPLLALASYWGARFWRQRPGNKTTPERSRSLEWAEMAYLVFYAVAMVGSALLGTTIVARVFGIGAVAAWSVGAVIAAWLAYFLLAFVVGYVAQGILSAYKAGGSNNLERLSSDNVARRERVFMGSLWAKLAFLLLFLGYALLVSPGDLIKPLFFGFVIFWIVDLFGAIMLLLVD